LAISFEKNLKRLGKNDESRGSIIGTIVADQKSDVTI
jgi:hypothetical protein